MPNQYGIVEKIARVCQHCGETFFRYPSELVRERSGLYCSRPCRYTASRGITTVERTCLACGTVFKMALTQTTHGRGRYCSRACYAAARTGTYPPCEQCGKPIIHPHGPKRFCSRACHIAHRVAQPKNKTACTCLCCGATFYLWTGELKKPSRGKYCSKRCAGLSRFNVNPKNWSSRWRNGSAERRAARNTSAYRDWRKIVLACDKHACRRCGKRGGNLHVHHIKGWATHPELRYEVSNGETLCRVCHGVVHGLNFSI